MLRALTRYTLIENISAGASSLTLLDASNIAASGTVFIEGEEITYSSVSTNTLTVNARGVGLSNPSKHSKWADVWHVHSSYTITSPATAFRLQCLVPAVPTSGSGLNFTPEQVRWKVNGNVVQTHGATIYDGDNYNSLGPCLLSIEGSYYIEVEFIKDTQLYSEGITVTVSDWDVLYVLDDGTDEKASISALTPDDPGVGKSGNIVTITPDIDSGVTQDWTQYIHVLAHCTATDIDSIEVDWGDTNQESFPLDGTVSAITNIPESPSRSVNARLSHDYTSDASITIDVESAITGPTQIATDSINTTVARTAEYNVTHYLIERRVESQNDEAYIQPSKSIISWSPVGASGVFSDLVDSRGYEYRIRYRTDNINGRIDTEQTVTSNFSSWVAHP